MLNTKIDEILTRYAFKKENLLPMLLDIQACTKQKYIEPEVANYIAGQLGMPNAQLSEVLTFFAALNDKPKGKYHIEMCNSTVCRVNENQMIQRYIENNLKISIGETSTDGIFSFDYAPCFGACDISPSIRINKKAYGHLTIERLSEIIDDLKGAEDVR